MVAPYHLKTFGENLREISKDPSSLASRLLLNTHSCPNSFRPPPPISRLRHCIQNTVSFEEGNECDVASARTDARGHPVRSDHQGSDEGGQCVPGQRETVPRQSITTLLNLSATPIHGAPSPHLPAAAVAAVNWRGVSQFAGSEFLLDVPSSHDDRWAECGRCAAAMLPIDRWSPRPSLAPGHEHPGQRHGRLRDRERQVDERGD